MNKTAQRVFGTAGLVDRRRKILGNALIQSRPDEVCLRRKPAVERSLTDSCMTGDGLDRCIGPELGVDVPRGTQNPLHIACRVLQHGVSSDQGEILVTGATGGVGSIAIALLTAAGFNVAAATGKSSEEQFLKQLGAVTVLERGEFSEAGKPLQKERGSR